MNAQQKIEAIAKEKAGHGQTLETLQAALDAAADAGDLAEVKRVQTETAAVQELVASCDRRAEKLQSDLIAEQKAAQRKANALEIAVVELTRRIDWGSANDPFTAPEDPRSRAFSQK